MRYSSEHKQNTRARVLDVGGALAKEGGFGTTGVDTLMAAAGLTSGAFYAHFRSKGELLTAIVENELTRSVELVADKTDPQLVAMLEAYLSLAHVKNPAQGCALTSLSSEVARSGGETQQTYERLILQIKAQMEQHLGDEKAAWAMLSQMVGAVMIARAMTSDDARRSLLAGVLQQSKDMLAAARQSLE